MILVQRADYAAGRIEDRVADGGGYAVLDNGSLDVLGPTGVTIVTYAPHAWLRVKKLTAEEAASLSNRDAAFLRG